MTKLTFKSVDIKKYITEGMKYIYISIKQAESNKHEYCRIASQVLALPTKGVENSISFPSDTFNYGHSDELSERITLELNKNNKEEIMMEAEYSSSSQFEVTFNPFSDSEAVPSIDYSRKATEIITKSTNDRGKSFFSLDLSKVAKGIAVSLSSSIGNFALKYQCGLPNAQFRHLAVKNWKITFEQTNLKLKATIEPIVDTQGNVVQADYYLNFYSTNNQTTLEAIFVNQKAELVKKVEKAKSQSISFEVVKRNGDFYANAVVVHRMNGFEEIIVYEPNAIIAIKDGFPTWAIALIAVLAAAIIGLSALLICLYVRMKNARSLKNEYKKVNEVTTDPLIRKD